MRTRNRALIVVLAVVLLAFLAMGCTDLDMDRSSFGGAPTQTPYANPYGAELDLHDRR